MEPLYLLLPYSLRDTRGPGRCSNRSQSRPTLAAGDQRPAREAEISSSVATSGTCGARHLRGHPVARLVLCAVQGSDRDERNLARPSVRRVPFPFLTIRKLDFSYGVFY